MQAKNQGISRHLWFGISALLIGGIFYASLKEVITLARHSEFYSHVIVVPFVTGYFLFLKRNRIASEMKYSFGAGIALLAGGTLLYFVEKHWGILLSQNDYLSVMMFSAGYSGQVRSYSVTVLRPLRRLLSPSSFSSS